MSLIDTMFRRNGGDLQADVSERWRDIHGEDDLESGMAQIVSGQVSQPRDYAPPAVRGVERPVEVPTYVQHAEGVDTIGKITSGAVITQYEQLASTIEAMREPLKQWIAEYESALAALNEQIAEIDATAAHIRDLGAGTFKRLQQSSLAIAETRKACTDVRAKIEAAI